MKLYNAADEAVMQRLRSITQKSHERLVDAKVTVGVLFVVTDDEKPEPCLRHQGYDAIAIVSSTPTKHRAKGAPDALIEIDQVRWHELGEAEQDAVLDHELTHIEPQLNDANKPKRDGCGRPKLKMRLHDHQFGWFDEIAVRHRAQSQEVQQYQRLYENVHQQWFAFAEGAKARPPRKSKTDDGLKQEISNELDSRGILKKGKKGGTSFEKQFDDLVEGVAKKAGVKIQKNVTIKTSRRRAAQR